MSAAKNPTDTKVAELKAVAAKKVENEIAKFRNEKIRIESNVDVIGPNSNPSVQAKPFAVRFSKPFDSVPQVTANTLQDPNFPHTGPNAIDDTFALSITSISREGWTGQVVRVDQDNLPDVTISLNTCSARVAPKLNTWGQNLMVSWIAVGSRRC